ncbi:MAG: tetratricopeptide repeat protein [Candidatus Obscuribacterales bacterium]
MNLAATSLLLTISSLTLLSSPAAAKPQHGSTAQHEGTSKHEGTTQHETLTTAQGLSADEKSAEEKIAAGERARRQGNYPQAQSQIKLGLKQIQNSKNPSPERLAAAYNYLALLNNSMGQYADSEQNARRALSLGRQAKLSENILARHRVVLANALRQQGKYPEAQNNLEKAIATLKTSNHDKELFATATNNLGALYFWMGNYQQAITILKRGLALRLAIAADDKENLDNENLDIANSYLDLGCTEFKLGQNAKAKEHLSLALAIRKNKLGDNHPETLNAMANLAALLDASGAAADSQKSLNSLQQVVKSGGKKLDADHPDLIRYQQEYAEALTNQASRLSTKGQQQQALEAIQQAIKLRETTSKTLGHKDVSYAITLANAATILKRLGKPQESKTMLIKAKTVLDGLPKSVQQSPEGKAIRHACNSSNLSQSNIKDH